MAPAAVASNVTHRASRHTSSSTSDSDIENEAARVNSPRNKGTLESVSSLRDTHSGSITEIKVWSHAQRQGDATSPPIEPVSSQSSTSEESSNQRPKYTLPPPSNRKAGLKQNPSGRDILVETVSSLRDVASASISDLKEWAATHTRSDPIQTVSSSVSSSSSSSMLDSKPKAHDQTADTKPALNSAKSREALLESVSSLREVASETMAGISTWAKKLPKTRESSFRDAVSETRKLYSRPIGEAVESPERATRTLYGAQTGMETMKPFPESNTPNNRRMPCSPQLKMMQDLVSPFLVCTSGATQTVVTPDDDKESTYHVDLSTIRDRKGQAVTKELSAWANWNPIIGALDHRVDSFDESILTYDSEAEEMEQIRRMTSWGTLGTMGTTTTLETARTLDTVRTLETSDGTMVEATVQPLVQDDEGNLIHPVLLEKAKRRREERKKRGSRTRLVKFDYPPISSLRECPRTDPEDLPNLFFTEEELDQIEDDRYNTKIADDVEIVAISSIKSTDESLSDGREDHVYSGPSKSDSSSKRSPSGASFSKYTSTPKLRNKRRPSSPFPRKRSGSSDSNGFEWNKNQAKSSPDVSPESKRPPKVARSRSSTTPREQRLIKGVQIFLRERSTGSR